MGKTIMVCPHCGRLSWLPNVVCVHCSCLMTNYRRWIAADDAGKAKILSEINQPKEYKPMYGPSNHPERIEEAEKTDAKIRRYLEKEKEQAEIEAAKPKYVPHCPTCSSPDIEKISGTSKVVDAVVWGIWSKKAGKTFKCRNCGYEW